MSHTELARSAQRLAQQAAVWVQVVRVQGSAPRGTDAWLLVWPHAVAGSIGGGQLEFQAIAHARHLLSQPPVATEHTHHKLGPSLGQCCGGAVDLSFTHLPAGDHHARLRALEPVRTPVALFGGGHVGLALVQAMRDLPFDVRWIDSRDDIFPAALPANTGAEHSQPVHGAVRDLAAGSLVLVMSFSHAEDFDIIDACLQRQAAQADLPFVGLIGSATKWATFARRLRAKGHSQAALLHITCPIGLPGIHGKQPAVIAASVVAQLLQQAAAPGQPAPQASAQAASSSLL
jgi:xanthine dehydrogenase accessory factor